ncbi:MAG: ribonuclease P protein component [Patescibacteria group bacterium]
MLASSKRISKSEFPKDFRKGKTYSAPHASLFLARQESDKATKYVFVTSAKVSKKATKRNTLRRRGYHAIKKINANIPNGYFCVFLFKKGSTTLSYKDIEKEIKELLFTARLLHTKTSR